MEEAFICSFVVITGTFIIFNSFVATRSLRDDNRGISCIKCFSLQDWPPGGAPGVDEKFRLSPGFKFLIVLFLMKRWIFPQEELKGKVHFKE